MPRRHLLSISALLASSSAAIVATAPLLLGADSGGVLPWTQWAAAAAALVAVGLALPSALTESLAAGWRSRSLALLLFALAGYAFLQSTPLPAGLLAAVAPGSADAYSSWLSPLARVSEDARQLEAAEPRISVDAALTRAAAWLTLVIGVFALLASHLFADRRRLHFLLIILALTGAAHACLGIYQLLAAPDATVWGIRSYYGGKPFGAFINRSNATVLLNLALGGSLGLLAWRLAALTGTPLNGDRFPLNELLDVALDRLAMLAFLTASLSLVGLLVCGSRSGLVGLVGGMLLALGMVQSANKLRGLIATAVGLALMAAIMMINLDLAALSADRVGATAEQWFDAAATDEARWGHWKDGARAAAHQPITGWGWGAYRFAYLPFQNSSSGAWFVNADNLWLEIFVEAGLFGLLIAAAAIWVIIAALQQLGQSVDPIDHGLAVAGWFSLGAVACSQLFDFGLRIPANAVMAAVLFSAVVARGHSVTRPEPVARSRATFRFIRPHGAPPTARPRGVRYARPLAFGTLVIAACLLVASTDALARRATGDKAIRMARYVAINPQADFAAAETAAAALADHLQKSPDDGAALSAFSQLTWRMARIEAAVAAEQTSTERPLQQRLQDTSRSTLRQAWYHQPPRPEEPPIAAADTEAPSSPAERPPEALSAAARKTRQHAVAALVACPLSPETRLVVLSFDFAGGTREQSAELLQQATLLRARHTDSLLQAGDLAGEAADWAFAASCWRRAVQLKPQLTRQVLRRVRSITQLRADDVIPAHRDALRLAATIELKQAAPDPALLARALTALLNQKQKIVASADDLRLVSRIQRQLNQLDDATGTLRQATLLHPRDPQLRWEYASALIRAGEYDEAKRQADQGSRLTPQDPRFSKLITTIERRLQHD